MAGQTLRIATAIAVVPTTVLIVDKDEMTRVLYSEHSLYDSLSHVLARNIRVEAGLIDQLFNSTEKGSYVRSYCLLVMARNASPRGYFKTFRRRPWHDRHDAFSREYVHDQVQKARLRRVQRPSQVFAGEAPAERTLEGIRIPFCSMASTAEGFRSRCGSSDLDPDSR
jgi:hypothetical protein